MTPGFKKTKHLITKLANNYNKKSTTQMYIVSHVCKHAFH